MRCFALWKLWELKFFPENASGRGINYFNIKRTRFLRGIYGLDARDFMTLYRDFQRFLRSDLPLVSGNPVIGHPTQLQENSWETSR